MNLSAPFINRPVMTTFVMLAILLTGWMAFRQLPVSDLPPVERPEIKVSAGYTGAAPETVLNQVTIPLEKELTHVKGVLEIDSKSTAGSSEISLTFDLNKDMDEAVRDVQAALNRADPKLPRDVDPRPYYHRQEGQDPIMYFILTSDSSNIGELRNYADAYILPRLNRIEGVAQVMTFGAAKSVWLRLNPELMAARQIGFNQVIDTVRQHTAQMPLGTIQTSSKTLALELSGTIQNAKELEDLKIGNSNVRLRDIGEVSENSAQNVEFRFVTQDQTTTALILGIQKISDANTVAISKAVQEVLKTINKELPPTIHLNLWFDKAIWIEASIVDVEWSLIFAFALVFFVIYLSLGRFSEAFIPSTALPLSILGTFSIMYLLEFNLDLLSLLALTLSVGFVVDDAIVVLENIVRHEELGASPKEASLSGSKQICFTILSMTLSLVAVFIPLLFMSGVNGRLFREFSITLAVAILVSGFISLTLTPMLCSRFLKAHGSKTKLQTAIAGVNSWMVGIYGTTLKWCFAHSKTILLTAAACIAVAVPLFTKLPVNLVPPEDRGFLIAYVQIPSGLGTEEVKEYQNKLEPLIRQNPNVENFLDINFGGSLLFIVRLHPLEQRAPQQAVIADLQTAINNIPGTQAFIQGYQLINLGIELGAGGNYKYIVRGMEFQDVENATRNLTTALKSQPGIPFVHSSLENDLPKLIVNVNEEQAHKLGFSKQQIQGVLQQAYSQGSVGTLQKGATQEKIFMELQPEFSSSPAALAKLYLTAPNGNFVPLKAVADWEEKLGSPKMVRRDQLPSATIKFSIADGIPLNEGLQKVEDVAAQILPSNVSGMLGGTAKAITSTIRDTLFLLLAAAVVMYIVLGILYESFIHPLTILSSLPFAGLGGVLTLFLFGEPISIFSAVGFLLLIGIVKKNGIMMVDYALEAQSKGVSPEQAIYEGALVRFRPIMMTTVAAIMGAIPIAIGFGDGAEMRRGLGLVIVGGLVFSQLLTLYVTPIIYLMFERLRGFSLKRS